MRESQAETARHTPLLSARKDTGWFVRLSILFHHQIGLKEGSKGVQSGFIGGLKRVQRGSKVNDIGF